MTIANELFNLDADRKARAQQEWELLLSLRNELEFSGIDSAEKADRYDSLTEAMRAVAHRIYN